MTERITCRWCDYFSAIAGETACDLCKPHVEEAANQVEQGFESREEALEVLELYHSILEFAQNLEGINTARAMIEKCKTWLKSNPSYSCNSRRGMVE